MNIAHLTSTFLPQIGGAEIVVHNLAVNQQAAGHQVFVIANWRISKMLHGSLPYDILPWLPKMFSFNIRQRLNFKTKQWLMTQQLGYYQKKYDIDVWHLHSVYPVGVLAAPYLRQPRQLSVVTSHGEDIQTLPEINFGRRLDADIDREVIASMSAYTIFAAISDSIYDDVIQAGMARDRIRVVPNGVNAMRIKSLPFDVQETRTEMGLPADKFILLTVGRNHPKKGYHLIPNIIKHLADNRQDFLWVIVGRACEPVVEKATELGIQDHLFIIPEIGQGKSVSDDTVPRIPSDAMIQVYRSADIAVFPSLSEASPLVHVESLAAGLPVVTTDAPGSKDVIKHGVTGFLSAVGDTKAMGDNILRLLSDETLRNELGSNGQKEAEELEWSKVALRYCELYEEIIAESQAS